ncbi:hypothetical protein BRD20_06420 [Halobacteriales archaeon SW_8_65_20]|nr:MAG: hypothetical protein BRD20_06420 [Halobacteriales archaeon SW_8_65_20]
MDIEAQAVHVRDALLDTYPSRLLAVGWYDADATEPTGSVYMDDSFTAYAKSSGSGALDTALLESVGNAVKSEVHDESLSATVRFYETLADIDIHVAESVGILVAVSRDGDVGAIRETAIDALSVSAGIEARTDAETDLW